MKDETFHFFEDDFIAKRVAVRENQPPSLPNSGDSYEEYLKIRIWKTALNFSTIRIRIRI